MKTKTVAYIDQEDLPSDEVWEVLWQMASFRHPDDETGWSFMVLRGWLESWLNDAVTDKKTFTATFAHVQKLVCDLEAAGHDCLFVCNDEDLRVK